MLHTCTFLTETKIRLKELSVVTEDLSAFDNVDFVPIRRISVLSLFNLRKFEVKLDFTEDKQLLGD